MNGKELAVREREGENGNEWQLNEHMQRHVKTCEGKANDEIIHELN